MGRFISCFFKHPDCLIKSRSKQRRSFTCHEKLWSTAKVRCASMARSPPLLNDTGALICTCSASPQPYPQPHQLVQIHTARWEGQMGVSILSIAISQKVSSLGNRTEDPWIYNHSTTGPPSYPSYGRFAGLSLISRMIFVSNQFSPKQHSFLDLI